MIMNDWPRVNDMVLGNGSDLAGWLLDLGLIAPGGLNISSDDNQLYYDSLLGSVLSKDNQGMCVHFLLLLAKNSIKYLSATRA
jgi:lysophospholipase